MVIHYVCKVVGRIAIGLDQDHIIQLRVVYGDVSVNLIVEGSGSLSRVILTDDIRHACCQVCLYLFPA